MKKIKVMHLVHSLAMGGMENGVVNICHGLPNDEFTPSICTFYSGGLLENRLDKRSVGLLHIQKRRGKVDPKLPFKLAKCFRQHQVDILHTHNWATLLEGVVAAKLARIPIVIHGEHGKVQNRKRQVVAQRWGFRQVTQVLSVSAALSERIENELGFSKQRIHVISNGVDTEKFQPRPSMSKEIRQRHGLPINATLVGMVARFVDFKDHAGFLDAFAKLAKTQRDVHAVFAGEGPLESTLRQQCSDCEIGDRVHFLGNIEGVERFLPALDVLVSNSSHCEGMSNAILEAMACGVPVIATKVAASPELLDNGRAGILIDPRDSAGLSDVLHQFLSNEEQRIELSKISRRRIEEHYSLDGMVNRYADLYRRFANVDTKAPAMAKEVAEEQVANLARKGQ